jgi:hypothetical protein
VTFVAKETATLATLAKLFAELALAAAVGSAAATDTEVQTKEGWKRALVVTFSAEF